MSEKGGSYSNPPDEEDRKKKRKIDDVSEGAVAAASHAENPDASQNADDLGRLNTSSVDDYKPPPRKLRIVFRNLHGAQGSSSQGPVVPPPPPPPPLPSSSSSSSRSRSRSRGENSSDDDDDDENFLVYVKQLTRDDVLYRRLVIPVEDGIEFLPAPYKREGRYDLTELKLMDHENRVWNMRASFYELNNSYLFWENWDRYVNKYRLQPDDYIFLYEDPYDDTRLLIEFQRSLARPS